MTWCLMSRDGSEADCKFPFLSFPVSKHFADFVALAIEEEEEEGGLQSTTEPGWLLRLKIEEEEGEEGGLQSTTEPGWLLRLPE